MPYKDDELPPIEFKTESIRAKILEQTDKKVKFVVWIKDQNYRWRELKLSCDKKRFRRQS